MHFEEIWEENKTHLKNFISLKVPSPEVPDILQTVSIEFYNQIRKGKEIKSPKSWLFQVTRNIISDYYKKKSRAEESELGFSSIAPIDYKHCACDIVEQVILALLPKNYSTPLILSDIHKIPQKDIAEQLGLTYVNVKTRIQRARAKIKEEIEKNANLTYNSQGQVIGSTLKNNNNLPPELLEKIKILQLED